MKYLLPLALSIALLPFPGHAQAPAASATAPATPDSNIPWERVGTVKWSRGPDTREILDIREELQNQFRSATQEQRNSREFNQRIAALEERVQRLHDSLPSRIGVQFKGGKLSELLAIVGHPPTGNVQIIPDGNRADLEADLPPFTLENADLATLFGVLQGLLERRGLSLNRVGGGPIVDENSYVGLLSRPPGNNAASGNAQELEALQLTDYLAAPRSLTVDAIVDALRTAWALDPVRKPADLQIKYHAPTKMLLIAGPPPTSLVVHQVTAGLERNPSTATVKK